MTTDALTAIIGASGSLLVAITALLLNYRGFAAIDSRFGSLESSVNSRFTALDNRMTTHENRLDRRLESIEGDLKEFFKLLAEHGKRIQRLEDKQ